jgi:prepilin-type N-terminal cleavage/methylation domain-containing protein
MYRRNQLNRLAVSSTRPVLSASPRPLPPSLPTARCLRPTARTGFTLIELLVVIGIILVLIAIVVVGLRHVNNTAARHETVAEMKICTDALKEYQNINGLTKIESDTTATPPQSIQLPPPWQNGVGGTYSSGKFNIPIFVDPPGTGGPAELLTTDTTLPGAGLGDMGDKAGVANPRWSANAVRLTQGVMYLLLKDPKNRNLVSSLPPKRILETPPPLSGGSPTSPYTIDAAVPLDGWGNPIIFVPRGGIHVWLNPNGAGAVEYIVRSSGVYKATGGAGSAPPLTPNDHPFFASAGQDGYFTDPANATDYAIDNLYSFQDQ